MSPVHHKTGATNAADWGASAAPAAPADGWRARWPATAAVHPDAPAPWIMLHGAPAAPSLPTQQELERICYEHTKLNPNLADDRELVGYVVNAMRAAIEASKKGGAA